MAESTSDGPPSTRASGSRFSALWAKRGSDAIKESDFRYKISLEAAAAVAASSRVNRVRSWSANDLSKENPDSFMPSDGQEKPAAETTAEGVRRKTVPPLWRAFIEPTIPEESSSRVSERTEDGESATMSASFASDLILTSGRDRTDVFEPQVSTLSSIAGEEACDSLPGMSPGMAQQIQFSASSSCASTADDLEQERSGNSQSLSNDNVAAARPADASHGKRSLQVPKRMPARFNETRPERRKTHEGRVEGTQSVSRGFGTNARRTAPASASLNLRPSPVSRPSSISAPSKVSSQTVSKTLMATSKEMRETPVTSVRSKASASSPLTSRNQRVSSGAPQPRKSTPDLRSVEAAPRRGEAVSDLRRGEQSPELRRGKPEAQVVPSVGLKSKVKPSNAGVKEHPRRLEAFAASSSKQSDSVKQVFDRRMTVPPKLDKMVENTQGHKPAPSRLTAAEGGADSSVQLHTRSSGSKAFGNQAVDVVDNAATQVFLEETGGDGSFAEPNTTFEATSNAHIPHIATSAPLHHGVSVVQEEVVAWIQSGGSCASEEHASSALAYGKRKSVTFQGNDSHKECFQEDGIAVDVEPEKQPVETQEKSLAEMAANEELGLPPEDAREAFQSLELLLQNSQLKKTPSILQLLDSLRRAAASDSNHSPPPLDRSANFSPPPVDRSAILVGGPDLPLENDLQVDRPEKALGSDSLVDRELGDAPRNSSQFMACATQPLEKDSVLDEATVFHEYIHVSDVSTTEDHNGVHPKAEPQSGSASQLLPQDVQRTSVRQPQRLQPPLPRNPGPRVFTAPRFNFEDRSESDTRLAASWDTQGPEANQRGAPWTAPLRQKTSPRSLSSSSTSWATGTSGAEYDCQPNHHEAAEASVAASSSSSLVYAIPQPAMARAHLDNQHHHTVQDIRVETCEMGIQAGRIGMPSLRRVEDGEHLEEVKDRSKAQQAPEPEMEDEGDSFTTQLSNRDAFLSQFNIAATTTEQVADPARRSVDPEFAVTAELLSKEEAPQEFHLQNASGPVVNASGPVVNASAPLVRHPPEYKPPIGKPLQEWSVEDVCAWAASVPHWPPGVTSILGSHEVNGIVLSTLSDFDVHKLGMAGFAWTHNFTCSVKQLQARAALAAATDDYLLSNLAMHRPAVSPSVSTYSSGWTTRVISPRRVVQGRTHSPLRIESRPPSPPPAWILQGKPVSPGRAVQTDSPGRVVICSPGRQVWSYGATETISSQIPALPAWTQGTGQFPPGR